MNSCIKKFRSSFGRLRLYVVKSIVGIIPKNKNLVLLTAWFGNKYIDNTKYVYEYLLSNSNYDVYWLTKNKDIYDFLKKNNRPVLMANTLSGRIKLIRAAAVFSTVQFSDYNQWLLSRTIYIDLGHGHPIKDPGIDISDPEIQKNQKIYLKFLKYYAIKASDFAKDKYLDVVALPKDRIFISDFARNDVFIDATLRKGKNDIVNKLKNGFKLITYMPTHRSDGKLNLNMHSLLPLDDLQRICEQNGWVFVIKKHFYHRNEHEDLEQYKNIFDITNNEDIDPQVLLYQSDALITDYSSCYIDYLLLDRPLIFYHFDIEDFQKQERSLYIPFSKINIAPKPQNKEQLLRSISELFLGEDSYKIPRNKFAHFYFNNTFQSNGSEKVKEILDSLMNSHYGSK